eukprot:TRINITY_DN9328_c0_g1_i2.p2 TRINITY_DN9328_c0_g1~~TRINITY_DN9328_c0_g1_i2.p2  ORF type:complete len:189 (+),score=57.31 TRINITY_DN9328_c0_g1_i2:89-655(+)
MSPALPMSAGKPQPILLTPSPKREMRAEIEGIGAAAQPEFKTRAIPWPKTSTGEACEVDGRPFEDVLAMDGGFAAVYRNASEEVQCRVECLWAAKDRKALESLLTPPGVLRRTSAQAPRKNVKFASPQSLHDFTPYYQDKGAAVVPPPVPTLLDVMCPSCTEPPQKAPPRARRSRLAAFFGCVSPNIG